MFDYKGKVVAITGASSGLGKQMAEGYAQCGADLVLMARSQCRRVGSKVRRKGSAGGLRRNQHGIHQQRHRCR